MTADRRWLVAAHGYGLAVAAVLGYFLLRIPIQLTDSFTSILALQQPFGVLMRDQFFQAGYLRPGLWAEMKLVHDLSGGEYFYWFRMTQALQVTVLLVIFVHILRPRTFRDALVVPVALAVLVGSHTFAWTVREAYPVNTFLTILLCCAAAVALSSAAPRWWTTPAAIVLFAVSALTVETGLLLWVILVGGYLLGWRGVSRTGIAGVCVVVAGYFVLRFLVLANGLPGLTERDSGFGFSRHSPAELQTMFSGNALPFFAYNVMASALTVLLGEPRDGVFELTRGIVDGEVPPPLLIGLIASVLATGVLARYVWIRRRAWLARTFSHGDRLVILFVLVLAANAAISFGYTKDIIMSPAGLFQAAAVFVALRDLIERPPAGPVVRVGAAALVLLLSCTWAIRAVGLHAALDYTAGSVREQWAYVDEWLVRTGSANISPSTAALKSRLQDDANLRHPARPQLRDEWAVWFEVD
ncbi:MAG: hypothetical protein ACHQRO_08160 [Vicinamibacteria bacterium]